MSAQKLLDQILPILNTVKDDEIKLQKIPDFFENEIYEKPEELTGFHEEDTNEINQESIPVSGICMSCKIH
jgi:hypothetical protein